MNYKQNKVTKFVVIAKQRSGSSWLIDLLNTNSEIRSFGEIFLDRPVKVQPWNQNTLPPIRFYEFRQSNTDQRPWVTWQYLNMINSWVGEHQAIGFKLMYSQLMRYPEILLKLILEDYKFIHLVRENHLDSLLSAKHKQQTGLYHLIGDYNVKFKRIYLNPLSIIKELEAHDKRIKQARIMLRSLPVSLTEITYELLCSNQTEILNKIADFLSINNVSFSKSNFKRIAVSSYEDKIYNYGEIKTLLLGTKFDKLLQQKNK
ncbi:MAG TPA: hypothetical protein DD379_00760 [Cyanobacteria bacterium UBA11162]|nr:hypothetical protein [Cyanobacteria bacterium UBA11162]